MFDDSTISTKVSHRFVQFISCMLLVVGLFSLDLYNPSLPAITHDLNVTQAISRGLAVAYLVGFSLSQIVYGPMADHYGRKPVIIISLALAVLGNLLTATATNGTHLLSYRFLTGIGAGGCPVISRAILRDICKDKTSLTKAFSIFAMSAQISPAFAPFIGGFIAQYYTWQINFVVLGVITLVALILLITQYKETNQFSEKTHIRHILCNYKSIIHNKKFCVYSIMSALVFSFTIGYYTINPFIFQDTFHLSPFANGCIYILYCVGLFIGAYFTKKLVKQHLPENILKYSFLFLAIVSIVMLLVNSFVNTIFAILSFSTAIAIFCGFSAPILISLSMMPFPSMAGSASALQGAIKMVGTALILGIILFFHICTGEALATIFTIISFLLLILFYYVRKA